MAMAYHLGFMPMLPGPQSLVGLNAHHGSRWHNTMMRHKLPLPPPFFQALKPDSVALLPIMALALAVMQPLQSHAQTSGQPGQDFQRCMDQLQSSALANGISRDTLAQARPKMVFDETVLPLLDKQPEFSTPIWDYVAALVDEERVRDGKAGMVANAQALAAISERYGIDPTMVAAVWGVESNFGRILGGRPLLSSLATLSCAGRRQAFFKGELMATLKIVQQGHIAPEKLVGSWAGAFGQTQFMPTTFLSTAVDFDGDGKRDVVDNAADALASTANFLKRAGWVSQQPWGFEVRLPKGFDIGQSGRSRRQSLAHWADIGIKRINGQSILAPAEGAEPAFTAQSQVSVLLPAGAQGPAFIVGKNFNAIYAYNAAESYALAIALLRDQLAGLPPLKAAWPTDDPGLSRAERRQLQGQLLLKGYDIGAPDGMIGDKTRRALVQVQQQLGLKPDGRAGQKTLKALMAMP
jgi:lytic murein transglycosylase